MLKDLLSLADRYDYDPNHNLRYIALTKLIEEHGINDALILGCGKGILEYMIPENVKCTSIDIDHANIDIAKSVNSGKTNRSFIVGDIMEWLKKADRKYQAVVISEVLEHLEDDWGALKAARNALMPAGGLLLLTVPNIERLENRLYFLLGRKAKYMSEEHLREYRRDDICMLLSKGGFIVRNVDYVYAGFLKERLVRRIIPVDSRIRDIILKVKPDLGTYIVIVSSLL